MIALCKYCGSTLTEKSYSRVFCSIQCYCADSYRQEPKVETSTEIELLRLEINRLRDAMRQVHALAEKGTRDWPGHTTFYALTDIHKITKGMVE